MAQPISGMAKEIVLAFRDLLKDPTNNEKLVDFVRRYFVSSLNAPEFYSALRQCLRPELFHGQPLNDAQNFFHDLYSSYKNHLMMEETLKSMDESLGKKLCYIDVCKKASTIFFIAAAMICAAAAATAATDANLRAKREAAAAAAAGSILFGALGKWIHWLLSKRETAVKKQKEITELMIMGARLALKDLNSIDIVACRLQLEAESKKMAAMKRSYEELKRKVESYSSEMQWVKHRVLRSIIKL